MCFIENYKVKCKTIIACLLIDISIVNNSLTHFAAAPHICSQSAASLAYYYFNAFKTEANSSVDFFPLSAEVALH